MSIHSLLKGHIARRIVYLLEQHSQIDRQTLFNEVYGNHSHSEWADQAFMMALRRCRKKLHPIGYTITIPTGGARNKGYYRLERISHD